MPTFAEWDTARRSGRPVDPTQQPQEDTPGVPAALHVDNPSVDELLSQAKGSLAKADTFSKSVGAINPKIEAPRKDYTPSHNTQETALGPAYQASPLDSPSTAFSNEFERSLMAPGVGALEQLHPTQILKNALGLAAAPFKGWGQAIPTLAKDPSLLKEAPQALLNTGVDYLKHPEDIGATGMQMAMGRYLPGPALKGIETATRMAPDVVGAPIEALGKGMEYAGTSRPVQALGKFGPLEALARGDWKGLAAAAVPPALEYGGKALKSVGSRIRTSDPLQGIMRAVAPVRNALTSPLTMGAEEAIASPHEAPVSTEHVGYSLPSEHNDFNYEKPAPKFHNRPSLDALARLTDSAPPYSGPERRTTPRANDPGADVFHRASRTGKGITDEQMNALLKRFGGVGR